MSKRYPGNFITGNPVALSQTSNSGIWDLKDQYQAQNNGTWQEADGIYEIGRSLRFRGSASQTLSRTPTVSGNRKVWTWSAWVKRGQLESGATDRILFSSPSFPSTNDGIAAIYFNANQLHTYYDTNTGSNPYGAVGPRLYRDPSAWYHIVWSVDAANTRHRVWVNNELVSTDTSKYPPNYEYTMNNSGYTHTMGTQAWGATNYFDGYMAEVNFVDGQELDPSYFGYTDSITGIWQPKRYTGAYGTNGFYILGNTTPETNFANYIGGGSSGNYLVAPYSTDFALTNQDFTLEAFVYPAEAFSQNDHGIFNFGENVTSVNGKSLIFTGYSSGSTSPARSLRMAASSNGSSNNLIDYVEVGNIELYTWNHVAITRTGGYIYVNINGKRTYSYNIGSTSLYNQTTYGPSIAAYRNSGSFAAVSSWPGAISNVRFTIGQCLYTGTSFTVPTAPLTTTSQGATSSNVKLLCCQSSTATVDNSQYARTLTNVGTTSFVDYAMSLTDRSGNGNTWSFNNQLVLNLPGNRSTANWDIMVDSPSNVFTSATDIGGVVPGNYPTFNVLDADTSGLGTPITNGNLTASGTTYAVSVYSASFQVPQSGKWYYETVYSSLTSAAIIGIRSYTTGSTDIQYYSNGTKSIGGTSTSYGATWTTGNVIGVAIDRDAGTVTFYKDNASQGAISIPTNSAQFNMAWNSVSPYGTASCTVNFGQREFAYAPPTGFKSINTTNIQALGTSAVGKAAIQANKWFDASLWGGTGTDVKVTNSGFQPDLVWNKSRSVTENHVLTDSVRGVGQTLYSNLTNAEGYDPGVNAFNTDGFNAIGVNGYSMVSWQWKQSPTSGFNIVSYTGDGTNNRAISHNLGATPAFIITKNRDDTYNWDIYHQSLGIGATLTFNSSLGTRNPSAFGSTAPTSSNFFTQNNYTNTNNNKYIAYVWAEVPGFSKFGSYAGNSSSDGPFIYCGFRPKMVVIRSTSAAREWNVWDTARGPFNINNGGQLDWSQNHAEYTGDGYNNVVDFLSNGFKLRNATSPNYNQGETYVYAAFAESPFGLNNRAR